MVKTIALNLLPGDEVQIDGELWQVRHHSVSFDNTHPVQMRLVACADLSRGKTVLTSLAHRYNRALRDYEDGPADNTKCLGMTENGTEYTL